MTTDRNREPQPEDVTSIFPLMDGMHIVECVIGRVFIYEWKVESGETVIWRARWIDGGDA